MQVDHHVIIGQGHALQRMPCQDFADTAVLADGRAFAAVSDGCSAAEGHAEIGALVITEACRELVEREREDPAAPGFGQKLRDRLRARRITGNPQDYYATLVTVVAQPDELRFYIGGDGAFAIEYADGEIDVTAVSWWHNAPYYPGIRDDPAVDPLVRRLYESCPHGPACETRLRLKRRRRRFDLLHREETWNEFFEFEHGRGYVVDVARRPAVTAVVMTDGVESFEGVPMAAIVVELLDFADDGPEDFAVRQLGRVAQRYLARGHPPMDDVAIAAIRI